MKNKSNERKYAKGISVMKKMVLINPPLTMKERYGALAKAGSKLPPLGLCNLASIVRETADVSIIDAPALGLGIKETFEMIEAFNPDLIGITAVTISVNNAAQLAKYIKEKECLSPIILGGPHVTAVPKETLKRFPEFDIAVIGEGEETLLELVTKSDTRLNLEGIKGLAFRKNGEIIFSSPRPFIKNLDELPLPIWDILPNFPEAYSQSAMRCHRFPSACLITSRGCYGKCTFCDTACFGKRIRNHSAEYVIAMIKDLINRYGVKDISFYDDNFIAFPQRISKICKMIIDEKLDITWSCDSRIDAVQSFDQLQMVKQAGCWQICYGIESGNQKILDEVKKNVSLERVKQVVEWTAKVGIYVKGFFMMGLPLETEETIKETINFAKELPLTNAHVTFTTPFPGSELYKTASRYGVFNNDWSKMNMWAPVLIPHGLSKKILQKNKKKFFREFYLRPRIVYNYLRMIKHPRQILKLISGFWTLLTSLIKAS
jgi:anaerobic magnesium-protoporphyrin IX monomethyl ester cyclase